MADVGHLKRRSLSIAPMNSRKLKISCSLEIEEKILGRSINDGRSLEE